MKIDLTREELQVLVTLLNQGRFTLVETQRIMPLANKLMAAIQNFSEEKETK